MIEHPLERDHDQILVGIDEAGRGPMAGPLVVSGVVFPYGYENKELDDSLIEKILKDQEEKKAARVAEFEKFVNGIEAGKTAEQLVREALDI